MKTKEQILKWLDEQPWKCEFYEEVFLNSCSQISYNKDFIINAFVWNVTKSGATVWVKRNTEFLQWYNSNDKPTSWAEYCEQNPIKDGEYYIDQFCDIEPAKPKARRDKWGNVNVMSKDLCDAFLAYMKLIQLRNAWVKGAKSGDEDMYRKIAYTPERGFFGARSGRTGLLFPTLAMAEEFINTFKDLLEVAKPLL